MTRPLPNRSSFRLALLSLALAGVATPVVALAADATIDQVNATARTGDISGALALMDPVLKDHPNSAKAHFVEAELLQKAHRAADARAELAKAEALAPGLPGISAHAKGELRSALGYGAEGRPIAPAPASGGGLHIMPIVIIGLFVFGLLAMLRRRSVVNYAAPPAGQPGYGPGYGQPGYGPGYGGPGYGGGGGGLMGNLASGAAMGAGFAVGEEVVDHMFGGGRHERGYDRDGGGWDDQRDPNADMGGDDFGTGGGGWDDGGSGGGFGGGDGGGGDW